MPGEGRVGLDVARFQIISVLGTGAQGVVALAKDHEDASTEPIVLKVLKGRGPDSASVRRLREEARILAWLHHPNIVKVHRLLEKDGLPIVVMEHVEGASASEQIRAAGAFPAAVAVEIAHRAAIALDAAYNASGPDGRAMRIVHRDVKPANLLVSVTGEVKVVDFGIAVGATEDGIPESDADFVGTPGYIAPERRAAPEARDGPADTPAVDVYALGATLFVMSTGKLLVQPVSVGRHDDSLLRAIAHVAPPDMDPEGIRALRSTLFDFCRFDPELRPPLPEVVARLAELSASLGPADLLAHAAARVVPIVEGRPGSRAQSHPYWPELAFLKLGGDIHDVGVETSGPPRQLALRAVNAPREIEPMLATLSPRPWWWFWGSGRDPASLVGALVALRGTRDPRAVSRAWELTDHADPRVTEAAWDLLAAAC